LSKVFIVLGMHKSGTTLVSQILHVSGINMGFDIDDERFQYSGNQCESPTVNAINNDILGSYGLSSIDMGNTPGLRESEDIQEKAQAFIRTTSQFARWGIKDPRMCLTYVVWKRILPEHALILVYRNPLQVWKHYVDRSYRNVFDYLKVFKRYIEYNKAIIEIMHNHYGPVLVVNYNRLMDGNEEFQRLQRFVGFALKDMRDTKLYKQRKRYNALIYQLHEKLVRTFTGLSFDAVYSELNRIHEKQTKTNR
jgi:hypothetical protein